MKRKSKRKLISLGSVLLVALFFLVNRNNKQFVMFLEEPITTGYEEPIQKKNRKYKK